MMMGIAYLAFSSRKRLPRGGFNDLIGRIAIVSDVEPNEETYGFIEVDGEIWKATCGDHKNNSS